jgi:hypothetical protein
MTAYLGIGVDSLRAHVGTVLHPRWVEELEVM